MMIDVITLCSVIQCQRNIGGKRSTLTRDMQKIRRRLSMTVDKAEARLAIRCNSELLEFICPPFSRSQCSYKTLSCLLVCSKGVQGRENMDDFSFRRNLILHVSVIRAVILISRLILQCVYFQVNFVIFPLLTINTGGPNSIGPFTQLLSKESQVKQIRRLYQQKLNQLLQTIIKGPKQLEPRLFLTESCTQWHIIELVTSKTKILTPQISFWVERLHNGSFL